MKKPTAHEHAEPQFVPPDERRTQGKALREAVPREAHGHWKARQGPAGHRRPPERVERGPDAATRADPLRPHDAVALHLLSRLGRDHGGRPGVNAGLRDSRTGLRRRPFVELRRLRHARAPHHLRHQRFRRDPAGALGVGSQAPGRQRGRRRPPDPPARKRRGAGGARHRVQLPRAHVRLCIDAGARGLVRHDRRRSLPEGDGFGGKARADQSSASRASGKRTCRSSCSPSSPNIAGRRRGSRTIRR